MPQKMASPSNSKVFSQMGFSYTEISRESVENKQREITTYLDEHQKKRQVFPKTSGFPEEKAAKKRFFSQRGFFLTTTDQRNRNLPKTEREQQPTNDGSSRNKAAKKRFFSQKGFFLTTIDRRRRNLPKTGLE